MPAYTENKLARMRERAIASAREMQSARGDKGRRAEAVQSSQSAAEPSRAASKPPERMSKPPEKPHEKPKPQWPPAPPVDDDRLLIIALIIILSADGADMLTIFALMYILM